MLSINRFIPYKMGNTKASVIRFHVNLLFYGFLNMLVVDGTAVETQSSPPNNRR